MPLTTACCRPAAPWSAQRPGPPLSPASGRRQARPAHQRAASRLDGHLSPARALPLLQHQLMIAGGKKSSAAGCRLVGYRSKLPLAHHGGVSSTRRFASACAPVAPPRAPTAPAIQTSLPVRTTRLKNKAYGERPGSLWSCPSLRIPPLTFFIAPDGNRARVPGAGKRDDLLTRRHPKDRRFTRPRLLRLTCTRPSLRPRFDGTRCNRLLARAALLPRQALKLVHGVGLLPRYSS